MVCCRGRQRFQVEEDVRTSGCGCDGRQAESPCTRARAGARAHDGRVLNKRATVCGQKCDAYKSHVRRNQQHSKNATKCWEFI